MNQCEAKSIMSSYFFLLWLLSYIASSSSLEYKLVIHKIIYAKTEKSLNVMKFSCFLHYNLSLHPLPPPSPGLLQ